MVTNNCKFWKVNTPWRLSLYQICCCQHPFFPERVIENSGQEYWDCYMTQPNLYYLGESSNGRGHFFFQIFFFISTLIILCGLSLCLVRVRILFPIKIGRGWWMPWSYQRWCNRVGPFKAKTWQKRTKYWLFFRILFGIKRFMSARGAHNGYCLRRDASKVPSAAQLILCLVASELSLPVSVQFCCIFAMTKDKFGFFLKKLFIISIWY